MRSIFSLALIITLISSGSYFYSSFAVVCPVPIAYRLGTFDDRFDLTASEALSVIAAAEAVWETSAGRELFYYDENADFPINFIFDDRQERALAEDAQRQSLDTKEQTTAEIGAQYTKLTAEYNKLEATYKSRVAAYDRRLETFNQTVSDYNDAGGAPEEAFADLKRQERSLASEAGDLETLSGELATIAKSINDLSERGNRVIEQYNAGVENYNQSFGETDEFTQGDYQGTEINIYTFEDTSELTKVLAHEFGHALGVDHVEGSDSIMYYLMEAQPDAPALTSSDVAAFTLACGDGTGAMNWLHRFVRSVINQITIII